MIIPYCSMIIPLLTSWAIWNLSREVQPSCGAKKSEFHNLYIYIYTYTCGLRFGCLECSWNIKDAIFLVRRIDLQGWRCHILKPPKCHLKKKSFRTQKAAARKSLSFAQDHICPYHWTLQPWHVRIFTCALDKPVIRIRIVGTRKTQ